MTKFSRNWYAAQNKYATSLSPRCCKTAESAAYISERALINSNSCLGLKHTVMCIFFCSISVDIALYCKAL